MLYLYQILSSRARLLTYSYIDRISSLVRIYRFVFYIFVKLWGHQKWPMKNFPFHCDLKKMANSRLRNGVGAQCSPLKRYLHSSPIIDAKYIPMVDILSVWSLFWSLVGKLWGWTTRIKGTSSFLRYPLYYSSVCHSEILYGDEWGSNGKPLLK